MNVLSSIVIGIGLCAACGFRVFAPIFIMALGARFGHIGLDPDFAWLFETPMLIALGAAAVFEIGAYYIPSVNRIFDVMFIPSAMAAGMFVMASIIPDMAFLAEWGLCIMGGIASAAVHTAMGSLRTAISSSCSSSAINTAESATAGAMALLTPFFPGAGAILFVISIWCMCILWYKFKQHLVETY